MSRRKARHGREAQGTRKAGATMVCVSFGYIFLAHTKKSNPPGRGGIKLSERQAMLASHAKYYRGNGTEGVGTLRFARPWLSLISNRRSIKRKRINKIISGDESEPACTCIETIAGKQNLNARGNEIRVYYSFHLRIE